MSSKDTLASLYTNRTYTKLSTNNDFFYWADIHHDWSLKSGSKQRVYSFQSLCSPLQVGAQNQLPARARQSNGTNTPDNLCVGSSLALS